MVTVFNFFFLIIKVVATVAFVSCINKTIVAITQTCGGDIFLLARALSAFLLLPTCKLDATMFNCFFYFVEVCATKAKTMKRKKENMSG